MKTNASWYVKTDEGKVYGPAEKGKLVIWAEEGRIDPSSFVSQDRISWLPAQMLPELSMKWLIETEPGKVFGPFNRAVAIRLFKNGEISKSSKVYCLYEFAVDQDPPPVEKIIEKEVVKEVRVEIPVEKIIEKEVIKEVRVEVPVEKIVEVEKIIEVPSPPRTQQVVAEVIDPVADMPPVKSPGSLFDNVRREKLAAIEAAAQRELVAAKRFSGRPFGLFGGKKR